MTLFSSILKLSGLSIKEASNFLGVRVDTVKSWSTGRNNPKQGVFDQLHELLITQETAAGEVVKIWEDLGQPEKWELGYAADDYEAQSLGWPSARAQMAAFARVWEMLHDDCELILSPRGSTLATAAAADAHEKLI